MATRPLISASDIIGPEGGTLSPVTFGQTPVTTPPKKKFNLGDPEFLQGLLESGQFDFLKEFGGGDLAGRASTFADTFQAPTGTSEGLFQDLIGNIGAPSSVDEVQREIDSELLQRTIGDIEEDVRLSSGEAEAGFAERGLLGGGKESDIARNALAQLESGGLDRTAAARLGFAGRELDRVRGREEAERGAFGARFAGGLQSDLNLQNLFGQGALQDVQVGADLLGREFEGGQRGELAFADILSGRESQFFDQLLKSLTTREGFDVEQSLQGKRIASQEGISALQRDLDSFLGQAKIGAGQGRGGFFGALDDFSSVIDTAGSALDFGGRVGSLVEAGKKKRAA